MPENSLPSSVDDTIRAIFGGVRRMYDRMGATVTSQGSANAQTLTYTPAPTAYVSGDVYAFRVGFTNTASPTLNINSLGAKSIRSSAGSVTLTGGELVAGTVAIVVYDGTSFRLLVPQALARFASSSTLNPAGTTSATPVMMGLSAQIAPESSTRALAFVSGRGQNSTANGVWNVSGRFGTGLAPGNGVADTGTFFGAQQQGFGTNKIGFSCAGLLTGLSPGTAVWVDVALEAGSAGGTATIDSVIVTIVEIP